MTVFIAIFIFLNKKLTNYEQKGKKNQHRVASSHYDDAHSWCQILIKKNTYDLHKTINVNLYFKERERLAKQRKMTSMSKLANELSIEVKSKLLSYLFTCLGVPFIEFPRPYLALTLE